MDRAAATRELTARLVARVGSNTSDEVAGTRHERVADFLSESRWQRERQQFFLDTPQVVAFAGQVAQPGSYTTVESMGIPLVLTRDRDGTLHCLVNACAHRGARVADGHGTSHRLTCGFHGWTYSSSGELVGRRNDSCFDPNDGACRLVALPVSDRSGLVVVGLDPHMARDVVDEHLADVEVDLSGCRFDEMVAIESRRFDVAANWKLVAGLSYESYHFRTLHRDSVATMMSDHYVFDTFAERHSRWAFGLLGIERLAERDPSSWPDELPGAVSYALFPGTVVIVSPGGCQLLRTEPGTRPEQSVVTYSGVRHPDDDEAGARAAFDFGGRAFETEDLVAATECQSGLTALSRLDPSATITIGRNEPVVQFWHRLWNDRLND